MVQLTTRTTAQWLMLWDPDRAVWVFTLRLFGLVTQSSFKILLPRLRDDPKERQCGRLPLSTQVCQYSSHFKAVRNLIEKKKRFTLTVIKSAFEELLKMYL